jgi:hypothetical protein
MAQATYSQLSINSHLKNLIQYDNIVITDDNQIAFDVYFNVPDGLIARMWEWDRTGWIPLNWEDGKVNNGQKYTVLAFDPFMRYAPPDWAEWWATDKSLMPFYILAVSSGTVENRTHLGTYPILPEIDIKTYVNNKIAPSLERCWEYFDNNDIWATVSGTDELTEEVDLKNGYFAQGFMWHINAIAVGNNPFANVHYWPKILRGDYRFIDPGKFTAWYPFAVHADGVYGTNDAPPIGTADFGYYTDTHGDCWTCYVNNTSGAALAYAACPTLQVIVVYKKG